MRTVEGSSFINDWSLGVRRLHSSKPNTCVYTTLCMRVFMLHLCGVFFCNVLHESYVVWVQWFCYLYTDCGLDKFRCVHHLQMCVTFLLGSVVVTLSLEWCGIWTWLVRNSCEEFGCHFTRFMKASKQWSRCLATWQATYHCRKSKVVPTMMPSDVWHSIKKMVLHLCLSSQCPLEQQRISLKPK